MWKQLLRVGLLYNIKVIEDTVRHHEEFSNVLSSKVLFVIMVQAEFTPMNCPLSPYPPSTRFPIDTGRKLNVHNTFRRHPGRLLNVLCTFNLRLVSTGLIVPVKSLWYA